ncbi:uncharacterized protein LOC119190764 [Manduca sexta]|uniref:uncharacterized protein LOC119190764 n=1 Tax=Manduca sexta TaxID=7130 RepID=UPI0018904BA2|nr:uncharacterized protein LOC119190764 [Manduca sexta]
MLTGHGCFGSFLCRIGKEKSAVCHHCGNGREDTVQHTLEECAAWDLQRSALRTVVGGDLSLPAAVSAMVGGWRSWRAMASFCECVISRKESAERDREQNDPARHQRRRRRRGIDD